MTANRLANIRVIFTGYLSHPVIHLRSCDGCTKYSVALADAMRDTALQLIGVNMKNYTYYWPISLAMMLLATAAQADNDICKTVLGNNTFDTYDYTFQSHIATTTASLICSLHISSRSELKSQEKNLQSGGQYGIISGFLDAAEASTGKSTEYIYDQLCNKHNDSLVRDIFNSNKSTITHHNVDAWRACVLNERGLFTAIEPSADGKTFVVLFNYLAPNYTREKLKLKAIDQKVGFDCSIDGLDVKDLVPEDHDYKEKFRVVCVRKNDTLNDKLVINTSQGSSSFTAPGKPLLDLSERVERLEHDLLQLKNATPPPQVDLITCSKVVDAINSIEPWPGVPTGQQIVVNFAPKECSGGVPKPGWKYTAILIKAVMCGSLPDYSVSNDPLKPSVRFYGSQLDCTHKGGVAVDWIGLNSTGF